MDFLNLLHSRLEPLPFHFGIESPSLLIIVFDFDRSELAKTVDVGVSEESDDSSPLSYDSDTEPAIHGSLISSVHFARGLDEGETC